MRAQPMETPEGSHQTETPEAQKSPPGPERMLLIAVLVVAALGVVALIVFMGR